MWIHPEWFLRNRPHDVKPYSVVHGHMPIIKYDLLPTAFRIVMLREPIENLVSIYYYWKGLFASEFASHAVFEFVKNERLSLLEMAQIPSMRRLMSSTYFGGYDMGRFDVIGSYDERTTFIDAVSNLIGVPLSADIRDNITPPSEERENVLADGKVIAKLRDLLQDDIRFFEKCTRRSSSLPSLFALRRFGRRPRQGTSTRYMDR